VAIDLFPVMILAYRFGGFSLDPGRRELRRDGQIVTVEPQVFDLLEFLIRNRDRVVAKNDIIATVWNGRAVSDSALTTRVNAARIAVGDNGEQQHLIRTFRRKGIRFVGDVSEETSEPALKAAFSLPERPSIAVLPFLNMSHDLEQEYFADGITEDIITALSHVRWLFVIARSSTFTYKGQVIDVARIGRDLGVRYILEGSVRRAGNQVRTTVQLAEAESAEQIWSQRYDRAVSDIFALQDEITAAVAGALEPEISASERERARRKPPESLDAWGLYQRGWWHLLQQNAQHFGEARQYLQNAIALDPAFAPPHAAIGLLDYFVVSRMWTNDPASLVVEMFEEGRRAVEIDANDSSAHLALGLAYLERGDMARAIAEHETALSLNPSSSLAHWGYGVVLNFAEQFEEGIREFDAAIRLSPRDPRMWQLLTFKASALYQLKRYDETIQCARKATRHPTSDLIWPFIHLAGACAQTGLADEAAGAVAELRRRKPGLTVSSLQTWQNNKLKSPRVLAHLLDGVRKAGLPE
jgi:TolB-like protein